MQTKLCTHCNTDNEMDASSCWACNNNLMPRSGAPEAGSSSMQRVGSCLSDLERRMNEARNAWVKAWYAAADADEGERRAHSKWRVAARQYEAAQEAATAESSDCSGGRA